MKEELNIRLDNKEQLVYICKALSSPIRIDILEFLAIKPAIISDVATHFQIPLSSAALHIKTLETAGLISVQPIPGSKGAQKLCGVLVSRVDIHMFRDELTKTQYLYQEKMPIGCYFDYNITAPCGIASEISDLGTEDSINVFYSSERFKAQLIWLTSGYLEYRFSNTILKNSSANKVQFTFEICSEALGYNNEWKSDVTLWINQIELGIVHCSGDFGGRKGKLNPYWWNDSSTQYGELRKLTITDNGCYIDEKKVSEETIKSLKLAQNNYLSFKIGVNQNANYMGGLNLFGEKFGDHPQNIVMEVYNEG